MTDSDDTGGINDGNKGKDKDTSKLSHVPCKFYRVGGCTAGHACPFSHTAVDRGGPREVCNWFIKGNCKFGHKCALAHLLPGQPMAMDRKNKKAAQLANASSNMEGQQGGSRDRQSKRGRTTNGSTTKEKNSELSNTRSDSQSRRISTKPAGNLTATAPAPEGETDFNVDTRPEPSKDSKSSPSLETPTTPSQHDLPPVVPNARPAQQRFSSGRNASSDLGYGPIGSPTRAAPNRVGFQSTNSHFSPGTSPNGQQSSALSTSPYGKPENTFFGVYKSDREPQRIAASLARPVAIQKGWHAPVPYTTERGNENAVASDEDDFEEFLPSSLTDLLTPEERKRRLSRSGGTRTTATTESNHRYSRSVPAARLLDGSSIWKDTPAERDPANISASSLSMRSGFTSDGLSPSHLGTSNASGAFLGNYHRATGQLARPLTSQSYEESDVLGTGLLSNPKLSSRNRYEGVFANPTQSRFVPLGGDALSPSSRALQSHAPGQSLPQGLAAGLSRLHLVSSNTQSNSGSKIIGMDVKTTARSPLRSQFVGTPPTESISAALGSLGTPNHSQIPSISLSTSPAASNGAMRRPWPAHSGLSHRTTLGGAPEDDDGLFEMDR